MRRITLSLPVKDLEYIEKLSQQKALSTSEYARMLIRLGLNVEKNVDSKNKTHLPLNLEQQKFLWQTLLSWELETRYLIRHLIEENMQQDSGKQDSLLETAKIKAQERVEELLQQFND